MEVCSSLLVKPLIFYKPFHCRSKQKNQIPLSINYIVATIFCQLPIVKGRNEIFLSYPVSKQNWWRHYKNCILHRTGWLGYLWAPYKITNQGDKSVSFSFMNERFIFLVVLLLISISFEGIKLLKKNFVLHFNLSKFRINWRNLFYIPRFFTGGFILRWEWLLNRVVKDFVI